MTISPDWARVKEIFQAALERAPAERGAFVREACADSEHLRVEVESLLQAHEAAGSFAEASPVAVLDGPALQPGDRLGPYVLVSVIGHGGMGEVYKAHDTRLDRDVAIKVLPAMIADEPAARARFEREARAIAALSHPHICTLFDIGQEKTTTPRGHEVTYLVMEHLEGETLADRLKRGPLPLGQALEVLIQIAGALEKVHRLGIVHRDLKPANVMLTRAGVKLLDFGLAKIARPSRAATGADTPTMPSAVSSAGALLGTILYMAPEQLEGQPADARTDLFALGVIAYEVLTGHRPFDATSEAGLIGAILRDRPTPIRELVPLVPERLARVVEVCLEKNPDQRWQSATDLQRELRWIVDDRAADIDSSPVNMVDRRAPMRFVIAAGVHRAWIPITVLLVTFVAALIPAFLYFGSAPPHVRDVRFEVPLRSGPGLPRPAISPDGRRVVYVASNGRDRTALWMRSLNAADDEMLPGSDGATFPFWSPDSRWIAFFSGGQLKKVDTAGGQPEPIADIAGVVRGGTWNRDGFIVFASTVLRRIAASGGDATDLTELDMSLDETFHIFPSFLPDGRHFLYLAWSDTPENRAIYIGSLGSKARTRLMAAESMAAYAPPGFVLFGREGILMARPFDPDRLEFTGNPASIAEDLELGQLGRGQFGVSGEGTLIYRRRATVGPNNRQLLWMDRMGKSRGPVGAPFRAYGLRLSPDGKRVAFAETSGASGPNTAATDLWIYDTGLDMRTKLTSDPAINHWPVWSPDGTRLVFDSSRDRNLDGHALYEKPANGAMPERLLLEPGPGIGLGALDWSRDGQLIVFSSKKAPARWPYDIWVLPLSGDRKPFPYLTTPFDEPEASLSPNGRWLAYTSNESGSYQVFVQSFPDSSRDRRQISTQGGVHPRWSGDGKEIYYLDHDSRIMAVEITTDQNLEIGKSTPLFEAPLAFPVELAGGPAYPYDVTPDGQWFLVSAPSDTVSAPLVVVLDWAARFNRQ